MSRIVYVNGEFLPEEQAKVSVFDRAFLFADAVYEVTTVLDGKLVDFEGHAHRLERSLRELNIRNPLTIGELLHLHREIVARNELVEGDVYLQIGRGVADRDFLMPEGIEPSVVLFTMQMDITNSPKAETGMKVISVDDLRWKRRDIKTVQLLYPSIAKTAAKAAGVDDAWFVEDGCVTEGSSNNAYIVTRDGRIVTRQIGHEILSGITRAAVLRFAREAQMVVEERPFSIQEAQDAAEAFITSATTFVTPVVEIDGVTLGSGKPGPVAKRLREIYFEEARKSLAV
jgi:D-alanine transaminase